MIELEWKAQCLQGCGWTAVGDNTTVDRAANKHTKTTKHATSMTGTPTKKERTK